MSADSEDSGDPVWSPVLIWRGNAGLRIAARLARLKIVISRVVAARAKRHTRGERHRQNKKERLKERRRKRGGGGARTAERWR